MPKLLENMTPEGAKKLEQKKKKIPDAYKEDPRELPRPEMRPEKSRKGLQGGAQGPRGAPEANQGRKVWKTSSKIDVCKEKHQIP